MSQAEVDLVREDEEELEPIPEMLEEDEIIQVEKQRRELRVTK